MQIAVVTDGIVENVVSADNAEEGTFILQEMYPNSQIVLVEEENTKIPYIGFGYKNNKFIPFKPYDSWTFNEDAWQWESPVPRPDGEGKEFFYWDEASKSWKLLDIEEAV